MPHYVTITSIAKPYMYKSIFIRKTEFIMPRITKSVTNYHLFNTVKNYAKLTGQEVGVIVTNKEGNTTAIGKQSIQIYVREHRREIVRVMIRASSSPERDLTHSMWDDSVMSTLDSNTDLSTHMIERLRHLLTSAIQKSTGK